MEGQIFADLRRAVPKARAREARRNEWISAATWRLVDERVSVRRDPAKGQTITRILGRAIKASLTTDRRRQAEEEGEEVETLVGEYPPLIQEEWHQIKGWYKAVPDRSPPPPRVTLERITEERVSLYSYVPPLGKNIPIYVNPFPVDNWVPKEDEIEWAVKRLRNNRSGGLSGMRTERLKRCLATARKAEKDRETAGK